MLCEIRRLSNADYCSRPGFAQGTPKRPLWRASQTKVTIGVGESVKTLAIIIITIIITTYTIIIVIHARESMVIAIVTVTMVLKDAKP